jgi:hypothetical protein
MSIVTGKVFQGSYTKLALQHQLMPLDAAGPGNISSPNVFEDELPQASLSPQFVAPVRTTTDGRRGGALDPAVVYL